DGETEAITTTADPLTGQLPLTEILVEVKQADQVKPCAALLRRSLHKAHNGFDDFQLIIPLELLAQARKIQGIFNLVFAIIGAITLFVGGIGIMNIMLANISERIHEIGLRRAVGARPEHIMIQFLGEAVLLTLIGGIIGILCGVLLATFLGRLTLAHWVFAARASSPSGYLHHDWPLFRNLPGPQGRDNGSYPSPWQCTLTSATNSLFSLYEGIDTFILLE
ncbi:FtsX-like permease family protein, partial [Desulfobulbus sp. N2]|nr:FtsX-like permease family protein [Desulfobulbus sp. N2]